MTPGFGLAEASIVMLRGLFPRLFGQYREGGLIVGKFVHTDSGSSWAALSTAPQESNPGMSVADGGTGIVALSFPTCNNATIISASIDDLASETVAVIHDIYWEHIPVALAKTGGPVPITFYTSDAAGSAKALEDPADGAVLTVVMMINK